MASKTIYSSCLLLIYEFGYMLIKSEEVGAGYILKSGRKESASKLFSNAIVGSRLLHIIIE